MIVVLPCAGGCALSYKNYENYLPNVYVYEYSGHWSRYDEPLDSSVQIMTYHLLQNIITRKGDEKLCLFGHSMGGFIAWLAAKELMKCGVEVSGLFIAACNAPDSKMDFIETIENDADIKKFLKKIRQVPENILNSEFFSENLLPAIRNDIELVRKIPMQTNLKSECLRVPITCFCAVNDSIVKTSDMNGWERFTSREFSLKKYKGNHFFVYDKKNVELISNEIKFCMGI